MTSREELVSDGMLNTTKAAEFLGISVRQLWKLMSRRELPWVHIGRARYIPKKALVQMAVDNLKWEQAN